MAKNKIIYGDETLIDLTNDTVSPNNLLLGETAHDRSGESIQGSLVVANNRRSFYGTCTDSASTVAKTVTLTNTDGWELVEGTTVSVKFSNSNTATGVTLNINGTGAKKIWYNTSCYTDGTGTSSTVYGAANRIITYIYDGTYWVWLSQGTDNNTTYSTMAANEVYTGTETTAKLARADRLKTDINKLIDDKVNELDVTVSGASASKTLSALSEADGKISASFQNIQIAESQVTNLTTDLGNKVDKVSGKGLSTNDYTTTEKDKLAGIAEGAEVNVQPDWNQTTTTADDYIKNKPTIPTVNNATLTIQKNGANVQTFTANASSNKTANIIVPTKTSDLTNDSNFASDANYVHTDNNYSETEKNKVANALPKIQTANTGSSGDNIAVCNGSGNYSYFKIANLVISGSNQNKGSVVFEISQRRYPLSRLQIGVTGPSTAYDIQYFTTDYDNHYWIKKVDNTHWELYGQYNEKWGSAFLHRITGAQANRDVAITVVMQSVEDIDTSTMVQVEYGGNAGYATSAGNASTVGGKTITDTYSGTSTNGMSGVAVKSAIDALDVTVSGASSSKTLASLTETDGKIAATFQNIAIAESQVTNLTTDLGNKVDKVSGKGLSTNDYTTTEKNKLAGIASGAEVNVQSDWDVSDTSSDAFIKNKPTIPDISTKVSKSGDTMSGNLKFSAGKSITTTDKAGKEYYPIRENGSNLWIGASEGAGVHHAGSTYISTGVTYNSSEDGVGNTTAYLSIPTYTKSTNTWSQTAKRIAYHNANPTSGRVMISDGTAGGIKSSDYTIKTSVPEGAVFTDTTYTISGGTNKITVTPSSGSAYDVTVTPSISNNITGSGTRTSGYLAKFSGTNAVTNGPQLGNDSGKYLKNDGTWDTPAGTYTLPVATSDNLGGIKIGYSQTGKNYPVQLSSQKAYVNVPWTDTDKRKAFFGTTTTAAATATKVVTLNNTDGWELKDGVVVGVYFNTDANNTASNVKLNVNGSGAKSVSQTGNSAYASTNANITGRKGYTTYYMYNGTYWCFLNASYNVNTDTDTKVTQTVQSSNTSSYPLLFSKQTTSNTDEVTESVYRNNDIYVTPSANRLTVGDLVVKGSFKTLNAHAFTSNYSVGTNWDFLDWGTGQNLRIAASEETAYRLFLGVANSMWGLAPDTSENLNLGTSGKKWKQVYAASSTISTSDRNEKKDISPLDESAKDLIMALNPVSYKFINGDTGRIHYGMISQDIEETLSDLGMTAMDFAGFCKDEKEDKSGYIYGLRYEEFIAPMIKTIQMQQKEIDELKAQVKLLLGGKG